MGKKISMLEDVIRMLITPLKQEPSQEVSPERAYVIRHLENMGVIPRPLYIKPEEPKNTTPPNLMLGIPKPNVTQSIVRNINDEVNIDDVMNSKIYANDDGKYYSDNDYMNWTIFAESSGNPNAGANNKKGAKGLTQIIPSTWARNPNNATRNILNPQDNYAASLEYTQGIAKELRNRGTPITYRTLRDAHNFGSYYANMIHNFNNGKVTELNNTLRNFIKKNVPLKYFTGNSDAELIDGLNRFREYSFNNGYRGNR